jgi:5-methylthioadenosine/S-adenosylhomocysteine deaminase
MAEPGREERVIDCDTLIRNAYLVTVDTARRVIERGAVAITGREIVAIGEDREIAGRYRAKRTFDAAGATVHPGFIDPHVHIVHGTCRGIYGPLMASAPKVPFADWKADVTSEDEHAATQLGSLELLRSGFTGFIEPGSVYDPDAAAEAVESAGIRALFADCYLWDQIDIMRHLGALQSRKLFDRSPPNLDRCLKDLGGQLKRNKEPDGLTRGYIMLYGVGTASDALIEAAKARADEAHVMFHQHEGYTPAASAADREKLRRSRIEHLAEMGALGENCRLVHMNVWDEADRDTLLRSGTGVIWCPLGYLQLGISGELGCRMPLLMEAGVPVAIATDGALDCTIGDVAQAAYFLAQGAAHPITPGEVIEMQTIEAARAAGLDALTGSLEPGKRADIVVRRRDAAELYPAVNPVHQLALTARGGTVDMVFVDGDLVFKDGKSTRLDEEQVHADAHRSVLERMARLGLEPQRYWPNG